MFWAEDVEAYKKGPRMRPLTEETLPSSKAPP